MPNYGLLKILVDRRERKKRELIELVDYYKSYLAICRLLTGIQNIGLPEKIGSQKMESNLAGLIVASRD